MQRYTITLSVVVHLLAACAALMTTLLATDELPAPRTATEFILVVPAPPSPPPPAPPRNATVASSQPARPDAAPATMPDGIQPERDVPPAIDAAPSAVGVVAFGDCNCVTSDAPPPPPPPPPAPVPVGGNIRPPQKVYDVAPVYPPLARTAHVEGVVILEAVIGENGEVRDVRVLRSISLLDGAAADAVRQWRFTPTLLNGQAVPVVMTITVAFKLR